MKERPVTIGELLKELKKCKSDVPVVVCGTLPVQLNGEIGSWRGDYYQVALGYAPYGTLNKEPITTRNLENILKNEIGKTEYGWKGGEYVMSENTFVWLDNPGDCCNHAIVKAYNSPTWKAFYLDVNRLDGYWE